MAAECYELSDGQWANIASLLPGKLGDPDRTGSDNRALNDGYLWAPRSGAQWRDLLERYGKREAVHKQFGRGAIPASGMRVFGMLTADRDNQYLLIDSTIVLAHQQATSERGGKIRLWGISEVAAHQGPYARRHTGRVAAIHRDGWLGWRHRTGIGSSGRTDRQCSSHHKAYGSNV